MKRRLNILIAAMFFSANVFTQEPAKKIPEFNFLRVNKTPFTNKDLAKNKMLLFVFFDVECEHCQHAIKFIAQHKKEFASTYIYLLTLDNYEKVTTFLNKFGSDLLLKKDVTVLQDYRQEFVIKFKPRKYPSIFLYSQKQELLMYDDDEQHLPAFLKRIKSAVK